MKTLNQYLFEKVPILSAFMDDTINKQIHEAVQEWLEQKRQEIDPTQHGIPASYQWHFERGRYAQLTELLEELK